MKAQPTRVLYSFPHKLGADRICYTAWQQVNGLAAAGAEVLACPGVLSRSVPANVRVHETLAAGKVRISYRLCGTMRALALHDWIVARRVRKLGGQIDIVHAWPCAARQTLIAAAEVGIPAVIERPNAHTRFAFDVVGREFARLGVALPASDEYFPRAEVLKREELEYQLAYRILCPSEFVVKTFVEKGVPREKLVRHVYGFDEERYYPNSDRVPSKAGLQMLFVGVCAVRKGVHFALEAWLKSPASRTGTFLIAGQFLPAYADRLSSMLGHPSVKVLGHRDDVPELMRKSDILVLPSIEEGSPLVIAEAMGSGCVPVASAACTDIFTHMQSGLMHPIGDVDTLCEHITMLHNDRALLFRLREGCLASRLGLTWKAAGIRLLHAYDEVIASYREARTLETNEFAATRPADHVPA